MHAFARKIVAVASLMLLAAGAAACGGSAPSASTSSSSTSTTTTTVPTPGSTTTSTSSVTATTGTPTTTSLAALEAIDWTSVTVPGAVCGSSTPITLTGGKATIPAPPGMRALTPEVTAASAGVDYGDLYGPGHDVAVMNVWCTNEGGTAAGELADSLVVYVDEGGSPVAIATLEPQQPASERAGVHVPYFDESPGGVEVAPGTITVEELWYTSSDFTCCPSIDMTTVWTVTGTTFSPHTTKTGGG